MCLAFDRVLGVSNTSLLPALCHLDVLLGRNCQQFKHENIKLLREIDVFAIRPCSWRVQSITFTCILGPQRPSRS